MTAIIAPAGLVLAAFAIDAGSLYTEKRSVQSLADLAAIAAAANLPSAEGVVSASLKANGFGKVTIAPAGGKTAAPALGDAVATVAAGRYDGNTATAVADRFVSGGHPVNAVKVTVETVGTRYFASSLIGPPPIFAEAIANLSSTAAFSIGSRLLRVDGGILNALLGGLLGGNVSLSVMDYDALVKADIKLFDFLDGLATELHLTGVTYTDVLQSSVTVGQVAKALADVPGLDRRSQLALAALKTSASSQATLQLSSMLGLGQAGNLSVGGHPTGLTATANALQMLTAAAAIANGGHQVALNLGATVPGLVSATLDLAIGEPPQASPWFTVGETGALVRTAQTRLLLKVELLGPGGLLGTSVKLPLYVELAYAEAQITDIRCLSGNPNSVHVDISAKPGLAKLQIAEVDPASLANFSKTPSISAANLVKAPLVGVTGSALVTITNNTASKLDFSKADIDAGAIKTVSTRDITQSLTASLLGNLSLTVKLATLGIGVPSLLKSTLASTLNAATPAVDQLLGTVLTTLGVNVGEADIRVVGASCGRSFLVQ